MSMTSPSAQQGAAARQQMPLLRTRQPISHSSGRMQLQHLSSNRSKVYYAGSITASTAHEPPAPGKQLHSSVVQLEAACLFAACGAAFDAKSSATRIMHCMHPLGAKDRRRPHVHTYVCPDVRQNQSASYSASAWLCASPQCLVAVHAEANAPSRPSRPQTPARPAGGGRGGYQVRVEIIVAGILPGTAGRHAGGTSTPRSCVRCTK